MKTLQEFVNFKIIIQLQSLYNAIFTQNKKRKNYIFVFLQCLHFQIVLTKRQNNILVNSAYRSREDNLRNNNEEENG